MPHLTIKQAIEDIKNNKMVILVDDEDRENEGDLTMAAQAVTPEAINFMARYGRGLICLPLDWPRETGHPQARPGPAQVRGHGVQAEACQWQRHPDPSARHGRVQRRFRRELCGRVLKNSLDFPVPRAQTSCCGRHREGVQHEVYWGN